MEINFNDRNQVDDKFSQKIRLIFMEVIQPRYFSQLDLSTTFDHMTTQRVFFDIGRLIKSMYIIFIVKQLLDKGSIQK